MAHDHPTGLKRWLFTTNHKDIGTLYLVFSFLMALIGGVLSLVIRSELFQPGLQVVEPDFYTQVAAVHALVMIFGWVLPAFIGLANWQIPMMIGAPDMVLPRINNWGFWLLPFACLLLILSLFVTGDGPAAGWTLFPPLSVRGGIGVDFTIMAFLLLGIVSILSAINIISTILNLRAPGMTLMKMPMFVWCWLVAAVLLIIAVPVLMSAVTMLLADRHLGTHFFDAGGGGDPVLFQHMFWFFGSPGIYVLVLPAFGIFSHIIPTFSRKPLFGYTSMVLAIIAIAFLSLIAWAHHMYTVGMPLAGELFFMYMAMLIAVPISVLVFNMLSTMWRGALTFETPMLWAIGGVFTFAIGGLSGLMQSIAPLDNQYHGTYFAAAQLHYGIIGSTVFALFGAVFFWLPKWTGHMYSEGIAKLHFWLTMVGVNLTFFPQYFLGLAGMPKRVPDYSLQFTGFNQLSSIGAFLLFAAQFIFVVVVFRAIKEGGKASKGVWENAEGLEWTVESPAPYLTFETAPQIK